MQKEAVDTAFWQIVQIEELLSDRHRLWTCVLDDAAIELSFTRSGLWIVLDWGDGASVAFRAAFSPGTLRTAFSPGMLTVTQCSVEGGSVVVELETPIGHQTSTITIAPSESVFSFRTTVRPRLHLHFDAWSRDIVPLAPWPSLRGTVHTAPGELKSGLIHASILGSGSFMYVQELSALSELCDATRSSSARAVGGEWPDIGFALPRGRGALSPSSEPIVLTQAHVTWNGDVPGDAGAVVDQYLGFAAAVYMQIGRAAKYRIAPDVTDDGWTPRGPRHPRS